MTDSPRGGGFGARTDLKIIGSSISCLLKWKYSRVTRLCSTTSPHRATLTARKISTKSKLGLKTSKGPGVERIIPGMRTRVCLMVRTSFINKY